MKYNVLNFVYVEKGKRISKEEKMKTQKVEEKPKVGEIILN